jgi:hypothetical protein
MYPSKPKKLLGMLLVAFGCSRANAVGEAQRSTRPPLGAPVPTRSASASAPSGGFAAPKPDAAPSEPPSDQPALYAPDGGVLEQTPSRPTPTSKWFLKGSASLFRAIAEDKPELARPFFFPLVAYQRVKAVADPERDYRHRLIAAFERDIHAYHQKLSAEAGALSFVSLDVREENVRWMMPGSEGNRLGYYRVLRSKLRFRAPAGSDNSLEVTSLISWRGEWYVVHLSGFK